MYLSTLCVIFAPESAKYHKCDFYPLLAPFVRIFDCRKNSELPISLCQWPKFRFFFKIFTQMFKYEPQIFYTQIFPKFVLFWKNCTTLYNFFPNFLSLDQKQAQFVPKWQNHPVRWTMWLFLADKGDNIEPIARKYWTSSLAQTQGI